VSGSASGRGKRAGHGEELLAELGEPLADDWWCRIVTTSPESVRSFQGRLRPPSPRRVGGPTRRRTLAVGRASDGVGLALAEIDPERVARIRRAIPVGAHSRPAL
jgi:hypothetical protein